MNHYETRKWLIAMVKGPMSYDDAARFVDMLLAAKRPQEPKQEKR